MIYGQKSLLLLTPNKAGPVRVPQKPNITIFSLFLGVWIVDSQPTNKLKNSKEICDNFYAI